MIDAPRDLVFRLATDIAHWPQMVPAITAIEMLTPGPIGIGTRFRETRTMFGRPAVEEMIVAEMAPPRRFVLTAKSCGTAYVSVHAFEAADDGRKTRLELTMEGRPIGLMARLLSPIGWLMSGTVRRMLAADVAAIKAACEREAANGSLAP